MKLRSLYILSIIGLFLVVVIQLGGMIYAYDSYKNEAKRTLNECFRQAFIECMPVPETLPGRRYVVLDRIGARRKGSESKDQRKRGVYLIDDNQIQLES